MSWGRVQNNPPSTVDPAADLATVVVPSLLSSISAEPLRVGQESFRQILLKTWSFSEALQMYVTPPSGVHNAHCFCSRPYLGLSSGGPHEAFRLRYLYDNYRASPRELGAHAPVPKEFEGLVLAQVQQMLPDTLRRALQAPDSDESSHLITRVP
jgi:hypothetical protein